MEKKKTIGLVLLTSLAGIAMIMATFSINHGFDKSRLQAGSYSLTLNNSNGISGSSVTSQSITTDSGNAQVTFVYNNCTSLNNGHATINAGGTITNTDHIRSIYALTASFSTSGVLKFRVSYDGATWGGYTTMVSTEEYELGSNPYYVEFSTDGTHSVNLTSAKFFYTCLENDAAHEGEEAGDDIYQRVEDDDDVTAGQYLIVCESKSVAFNGALTTLDATNNYISVDINSTNHTIPVTSNTTSAEFTLAKSSNKYTIKSASNKYIGRTSNSNGLDSGTSSSLTNEISISLDGTASIHGQYAYLKYNSNSNQKRFRYYTSGQNSVQLYKLTSGAINYDTPVDENGFVATDSNKNNYTENSIFDSDNGLTVKATFSNGTDQVLSKGANGYSYVVKNSSNQVVDTSKAFGTPGTYYATISYKNYIPVVIELNVARYEVLTGATIHLTKTTYNTADKLSDYLADNFTFDVTYNHSDLNASGLAYSQLSAHGLTLSLFNKDTGVTANINSMFGTAGTYTVKITNGSVTATQDITVNAILVTDITLSQSAISLVKNATAQLTVTVSPSNATNTDVLWASNNTSVATVSSTGLVTAVNAGTAAITATAKDGSNIYGSCTVTVTAPVENDVWTLVTNASTLAAGDELVIASNSNGKTAGNISSQVMSSITSTFNSGYSNITSLGTNTQKLTLGGTSGAWTLTNSSNQKLGATAEKKLAWGSGTTTWSISISSNNATIQNGTSSYGRFLYNSSSPRFTTYTSNTSNSMKLPQIYRGSVSTPIYPTDITISGLTNNTLAVAETGQLQIGYTPATTNQKVLTFASSNTNVATISNTGLITALSAGTSTITVTAKKNANGDLITKTFTLTVQTVAVTGVTLNTNATTIGIGQTTTLTATVLPTNATNKNVTWTTSNNSVASVSNGVVTAKAVGSARITVTTVNGGYTAYCDVTVTEQQLDKWTIMIYMCGSDLESNYASSNQGLATSDITEILSVTGKPDDVNIIIETGGSTKWSSKYGISATKLGRYKVTKNGSSNSLTKITELDYAAMGATNTFQNFLEWGLTDFPAQKTGVVLWNHGGGMQGVCYDETTTGGDDPLLNSEVTSAVSGAFANTGRTEKLEFIGYDACLMQVQDIAEFNSQYFNYMVASEESESGYGWDYDTWVDDLYADKTTPQILTAMCDGFVSSYTQIYGSQYDNDQTLSFLDLSYMSAYKSAWESMASNMYNKISSYGKSNFQNLMKTVKCYGTTVYTYSELQQMAQEYQNQGYSYVTVSYIIEAFELVQVGSDYYDYGYNNFGTFDVQDFLNKVSANSSFSSLSSSFSAVQSAFNNLVVYSKAGNEAGESYGLCLYFPCHSWCGRTTYYTNNETHFTNWKSIVDNFGE